MIYKSATKIVLILLVVAVIVLTWLRIDVAEPLKTISLMVISFYFWQKNNEAKTDREPA